MALDVKLTLSADSGDLVGEIRVSRDELEGLKASAKGAGDSTAKAGQQSKRAGDAFEKTSKQTRDLNQEFSKTKALVATLGLGLVAREIVTVGNAFTGYENALTAVTGSQELARQEMEFIESEAARLGLGLQSLTKDFTQISAASKGTAIEGEATRQIFSAVAESARVLNLSAADTSGALRAINQIMSKGTVQAEELRGQLGERIPGAFETMARAIGVTTQELNKMLENGEVLADEVLPLFAEELRKTASAGLELSVNSPAAEFARLRNELTLLANDIAQGGALELLSDGAVFLRENLDELVTVLSAVAALYVGSLASKGLGAFTTAVSQARAANLANVASIEAQIAATTRLSGVNTVSAAKVAALNVQLAAATRQTGLMTVATNGFNKSLSVLGGPAGILIGVSTLLIGMGASAETAKEKFEEFSGSVQSLIDNLDELNQREINLGIEKAKEETLAQIADAERQINNLNKLIERGTTTSPERSGLLSRLVDRQSEEDIANARNRIQELVESVASYRDELRRLEGEVTGVADEERLAAEQAKQLASARERLNAIIGESAAALDPLVAVEQEYAKVKAEITELAKTDGLGIDLVNKALKEARKEYEKNRKEIEENSDASKALITAQKEEAKATEELRNIYRSSIDELEPLLALRLKYEEDVARTIELSKVENQSLTDVSNAMEGLTAQYLAAKKELEKTLDPQREFKELLDDLARGTVDAAAEELLRYQLAVEEGTRKFGARAVVTQQAIDLLDQYVLGLQRVQEEEEKAFRESGLFGNGRDSIEQLIGGAFDSVAQPGGSIDTFFSTLEEGFSSLEGPEDIANAIAQGGSLLNFAIGEFQNNPDAPLRAAASVAAQIPGIVGAIAQAAQQIDQLVGGRLFGTNYEAVASGFNVSVGAGGFTGNEFVREERERSFFRGTATRTIESELDPQTAAALDDFFDSIEEAITSAARRLSVTVPDIIAGEFEQEFDADGKIVKSTSEVLGRVYQESFEEFQQRVLAENLIATIAQSVGDISVTRTSIVDNPLGPEPELNLPGVFQETTELINEAQFIAERWRGSAEELLEGAQFLLLAQDLINRDLGLLRDEGGLLETTNLTEELSQAGETLTQTYLRLIESSANLQQAYDLLDVSYIGTTESLVRLSDDIAQAAGGIDQARALYADFFESFFSPEEIVGLQLNDARSTRDAQLTDLGLDPDILAGEFRQVFEEALANGAAAEEIAALLEAGSALAEVIRLEEELADIREDAAQAALAQAESLRELLQGVDDTVASLTLTDFQNSMRILAQEFASVRDEAITLGATQEELARIQQQFGLQAARLVEQLRANTLDLAAQLFGSPLDNLNSQIAELESQQTSAIGRIGSAASNMYDQQVRAIERIRQTVDSLLLDERVSPLTPQERLAEADSQFRELLERAQAGDVDALNQISAAGRELIDEARGFFASSQDFVDIFDFVTGALSGLDATASPGGAAGGNPATSSEIARLIAERDAITAEQTAANRLFLAQQLSENITDLAAALGSDVLSVADDLGVDIGQLVDAFGINIDDLTVETVSALAGVSNALDLELGDLGEELGLQLGALNDSNSLLNDALEAVLAGLPEEFSALLLPALQAIEQASTPEQLEAAINNLAQITSGLPPEYANQLAPFLDGIDPVNVQQEIGLLGGIQENTSNALSFLQSISAALGGTGGGQGTGSLGGPVGGPGGGFGGGSGGGSLIASSLDTATKVGQQIVIQGETRDAVSAGLGMVAQSQEGIRDDLQRLIALLERSQ